MVDGIISILVVLGVFAFVAFLLALFVWRVDPYQFGKWTAAIRSVDRPAMKLPAMKLPAMRLPSVRLELGRAPSVPGDAFRPSGLITKSASARLRYWLDSDATDPGDAP